MTEYHRKLEAGEYRGEAHKPRKAARTVSEPEPTPEPAPEPEPEPTPASEPSEEN